MNDTVCYNAEPIKLSHTKNNIRLMPQVPGPFGSDDKHPFLTPKGMRLLRGNQKQAPIPMEFPEYPPVDESIEGLPQEDLVRDPLEFPSAESQPLTNIRISAKFPDPEQLTRQPLTSHYQSKRVTNLQQGVLKAIGKLFIQLSPNPRHELATGSAWITGPNTIATAAHNLFDSNARTWSRALEFHPGYDFYSKAKLPTCRVTACLVPKAYLL